MFYKPEFKDSPEHSAAKVEHDNNGSNDKDAPTEAVEAKPASLLEDDEPLLSLGAGHNQPADIDSMLDELFSPSSSQNAPLGEHVANDQ